MEVGSAIAAVAVTALARRLGLKSKDELTQKIYTVLALVWTRSWIKLRWCIQEPDANIVSDTHPTTRKHISSR